ncbi:DUF1471 domain-containing protein [Vibrio sp. 10N.261.51.F12]|uniref:DUF1471 domain-containing protein n=1 Tax=Vibrio sp. 10N.261.51.F12 TaxID=3229679 RepID=UPI00354FE6A2
MKKVVLLLSASIIVTGCVTRKVTVLPEAQSITPISKAAIHNLNCEIIDTYTIDDSHPNNVTPVLKNETYQAGGSRYRIITVLSERRGRPSSVVAEFYSCTSPHKSRPSGVVNLLPGAHGVSPISFAEMENSDCKVVGSHVVEKTDPQNLATELANEVFMKGGNRHHITKIIDTDGVNPTSVAADIYRCKHQSVSF